MNPGHGQKLTRKQEQAIAALLAESTVEQAATKAGISHSTLKRWLRDPPFLRVYRQARRELLETSIGRIQSATGTAVDTLLAVAKDAEARDADRIRAAGLLLDHGLRGLELADMLHGQDAEEVGPVPQRTADIVAGLGRTLQRVATAELGTSEQARLTAALSLAMLKGIEVDTLAQRLEALEKVLLARKATKR